MTETDMHRTAKKVARTLSRLSEVRSVLLVGSCTRQYVDRPVDVDLLVVAGRSLNLTSLRDRLSQSELSIADTHTSSDSICFILDEVPVGLAPITSQGLGAELKRTTNGGGHVRYSDSWAFLGWAPEVICADIVDSSELFTRSRQISRWKEILATYPEPMRIAILTECSITLRSAVAWTRRAVERGEVIVAQTALSRATLDVVRALFAVEHEYFGGMKHLSRHAETSIPTRIPMLGMLDCATPLESRISGLEALIDEIGFDLNRLNGPFATEVPRIG